MKIPKTASAIRVGQLSRTVLRDRSLARSLAHCSYRSLLLLLRFTSKPRSYVRTYVRRIIGDTTTERGHTANVDIVDSTSRERPAIEGRIDGNRPRDVLYSPRANKNFPRLAAKRTPETNVVSRGFNYFRVYFRALFSLVR